MIITRTNNRREGMAGRDGIIIGKRVMSAITVCRSIWYMPYMPCYSFHFSVLRYYCCRRVMMGLCVFEAFPRDISLFFLGSTLLLSRSSVRRLLVVSRPNLCRLKVQSKDDPAHKTGNNRRISEVWWRSRRKCNLHRHRGNINIIISFTAGSVEKHWEKSEKIMVANQRFPTPREGIDTRVRSPIIQLFLRKVINAEAPDKGKGLSLRNHTML